MPLALITGAAGGLGLEFVRQYSQAGYRVIAHCRNEPAATALKEVAAEYPAVCIVEAELQKPADVTKLAAAVGEQPLDLLINNAGTYGKTFTSIPAAMAAQSLGSLDFDNLQICLQVNFLAPLRLCEALLSNLLAGEGKTIANLSTTLGSNTLIPTTLGGGGLYAYRSSKAALNNATATLAHDLRDKGIKVLLLHPGIVRTRMGAPNADLAAADSVTALRGLIDSAGESMSGKFLAYTGEEVPW